MQSRQIRIQSNRHAIQNNGSLAEMSRLQQNIDIIAHQNKDKYSQILSAQPHYNVALYEPNSNLRTQRTFKKQLLLKQLDRLMDQENIFDKKLTQIKFLKEIESQQSQKSLQTEMNPYRALRTAWVKHQINAIETKNTSDRLESLNFTIGIIKNTVLSMKIKQQNHTLAYSLPNEVTLMNKCQKLQKNYQSSLMVNQQLRQQINSLHLKLQAKCQNDKQLQEKLQQQSKQIKILKKTNQTTQIDHKFLVAQLKQQIFIVEKTLQKLQKWKLKLDKNNYENIQKNFKIYFEINSTQISNNSQQNHSRITKKCIAEVQTFLADNSQLLNLQFASNNPENLNFSKLDQQNNETLIPALNLTKNNETNFLRKKMSTERPLKVKNFEFQKFVGNKLVNLKQMNIPTTFNLNDESMKKFVRKNQVIGTSRYLDSQFSERNFQTLINEST